ARLFEPGHEILKRVRAGCTFRSEGCDRLCILVVDDGGMAILHQPADDVAAHPAKPDHAKLHVLKSLTERFRYRGVQRGKRRSDAALEVDPQRTPAAFGEHAEIAARLRRLDDTKTSLLAGHRQILGV